MSWARQQIIDGTDRLMERISQLERAILKVEWIDVGAISRMCPWCHGTEKKGHGPLCLRQVVLEEEKTNE